MVDETEQTDEKPEGAPEETTEGKPEGTTETKPAPEAPKVDEKPKGAKDPVVNQLQKINNNLYAIRTVGEYQLTEKGKRLVWDTSDPKKPKFIIADI